MTNNPTVKTYIKSSETVGSLRCDYILALIPAIIWSLVHFGIKAISIVAISVISVILSDVIVGLICDRKFTVPSLNKLFCGLLYSLTLYAETDISLCVVGGALIPVFFRLFGNEERCTFFVPLISRELAILLVPNKINIPDNLPINSILNENIPEETLTELMLGLRPGMLGSISVLAVLLGAFYLIFRRSCDSKTTIAYILTYVVLSLIFPSIEARAVESTIYELVASDLLFVAFFILTDFSTTPAKATHRYLRGITCAAVTFLIRTPEATYNAYFIGIITIDMLTPFISTFYRKAKLAKESKNAK